MQSTSIFCRLSSYFSSKPPPKEKKWALSDDQWKHWIFSQKRIFAGFSSILPLFARCIYSVGKTKKKPFASSFWLWLWLRSFLSFQGCSKARNGFFWVCVRAERDGAPKDKQQQRQHAAAAAAADPPIFPAPVCVMLSSICLHFLRTPKTRPHKSNGREKERRLLLVLAVSWKWPAAFFSLSPLSCFGAEKPLGIFGSFDIAFGTEPPSSPLSIC